MLLFVYSSHLFIFSSSLTEHLDYLLFFSYAISVRFTVAFPSDGMHCCLTYRMTEVTLEVLQGQFAIYIEEKTACISFHYLTGDSQVGDILPVLTECYWGLCMHVPEGRSNNASALYFSVVDQHSSD